MVSLRNCCPAGLLSNLYPSGMVLAVPQRTASFSAARFGSRPSSSFGLSSCPAPLRIVNRPSVCFYSSGTQHQTGPGNQSSPTTEHSSGPDPTSSAHEAQDKGTSGSWGNDGRGSLFPITGSPLLDAALTTVVGLGIGEFCRLGHGTMRSRSISRMQCHENEWGLERNIRPCTARAAPLRHS
jgi:hypothetical protein